MRRKRLVVRRGALAIVSLCAACYSGYTGQADEGPGGTDTGSDGGSETGVEPGDGPRACADQDDSYVVRAPLRRLTRFEYSNTVRDLLGDDTSPGNQLPSEEIGNGFGNDADAQSVSSLLVERYAAAAEDVATRATETPEKLGALAPCAAEITEQTEAGVEDACAYEVIETFAPRAFRRPLQPEEVTELFELQQTLRQSSTFAESIAGVIEALLQSPDFLYRVELGMIDDQGRRRPTGYEMATRLSYFLWGTMPDEDLFVAAEAGDLVTGEGVRAQAERMLEDPRARPVVRFFFDNLLPISGLAGLERDPERFPAYSPSIGALMREETQTFLAHEIFEGSGSWVDALTAPYTFVNEELAAYYGMTGVSGEEFRKVDLDTSQRLGLLTQAGMVAGTIHSNETNPVVRGSFVTQKLMCSEIPLPTGDVLDEVKPPDPDTGATARERYAQHSEDPACAGCHQLMDPIGFALENYDPVGLWRDQENGVVIDASGMLPLNGQEVAGPIELVQAIAEAPQTHACFARHWGNFAYGRTMGSDEECITTRLEELFLESDYHVPTLLIELTQTDAFLYLPDEGEDG